MIFEKIERIAIAVRDLDKSIEFFTDLGIPFDDPFVVEESGAREAISPLGLELVEAHKPDSIVDKFIQKRGEGVFSVMIKVSDMDQAKKTFEEKGIRFTGEIQMGGLKEVSYHPKDTYGCQFFLTEYSETHPAMVAALEKQNENEHIPKKEK
jgi:methylmalonyl-CoA/ethylmalonyl-CoA epimerase